MGVHTLGHAIFLLLYILLVTISLISYHSAPCLILQYTAWILLLFGILFLVLSEKERKRHDGLIRTGVYSLVRHPEFLGHVFIIMSMILLAQVVMSLVIGAAMLLMLWIAIVDEERMNIEKFGEEYLEYMREVPRVNIIAGIIRRMRAA